MTLTRQPITPSHSGPSAPAHGHRAPWRWLFALLGLAMLLPTLLWLPWKAQRMEGDERQEQLIADTLWVEQTVRFQLEHDETNLTQIASEIAQGGFSAEKFSARIKPLLRNSHEITRLDWFDNRGVLLGSSSEEPLPTVLRDIAIGGGSAHYQLSDGDGQGQLYFSLPVSQAGRQTGNLVASYSTSAILEEMVPWWFAQDNEILLLDSSDMLLARRAAGGPGKGIYSHRRTLDLTGVNLELRTNSTKSAPNLLPGLLVGSVILLSLGLLFSLAALWRDINRRIAAEQALRQEIAFATAMENSLLTGLRARDLNGRVTYVNPAFCQMVGLKPEQVIGMAPPMPYWAPEAMEDYQQRMADVLAGTVTPQHETIFLRANGERFPVLIFESPLVDENGQQTGWMGSILDISEQRRVEELNLRQQEKLQAGARLATMGEMASTLAHELNQPLAAISSFATGALNLLQAGQIDPADMVQLRTALEKTCTQAQRAGQIIRSVHTFVKQRAPLREPVSIAAVIEGVTPLIELQARPFFLVLQFHIATQLPLVLADRVLLEQVLLNLTRNAVEAMRDNRPEKRLLRICAQLDSSNGSRRIVVSVVDQGPGIAPVVAERLFSPFFSTKAEGMGMGLNICRTAIEFHGGELTYHNNPEGGASFQFSLPALDQLGP